MAINQFLTLPTVNKRAGPLAALNTDNGIAYASEENVNNSAIIIAAEIPHEARKSKQFYTFD